MISPAVHKQTALGHKRFRPRDVILGLAVSGFLSALLYVRLDVSAFTGAMAKTDFRLLAPVVLLHGLSWWFRGVRWRALVSPFRATPAAHLFPIVMTGAMVNSLVPGRAGDFWRAHALGRREGLSRSTALGTIVIERLLDGIVFVLLGSVAALAIGASTSITILIASMVLLFALGLGIATLLAHSEAVRLGAFSAVIPERYRAFVRDRLGLFVHGLRALKDIRLLGSTILLTVVIMLIETAAYWTLGIAFGLDVDPQSFVLVVAVANLAMGIPFSLGGIGPFEFFVQQSLVALGASSSVGLAYAVSLHGMMLAFVTVIGLLFLWPSVNGLSLRRLQPTLARRTEAGHSTVRAD